MTWFLPTSKSVVWSIWNPGQSLKLRSLVRNPTGQLGFAWGSPHILKIFAIDSAFLVDFPLKHAKNHVQQIQDYSHYSYILLSLEAHATSGANPACYTVMLSINGRCLELGSSSEPLVYLPMNNKFSEDQGRPIISFSRISHIKSYIIIIYIYIYIILYIYDIIYIVLYIYICIR
jgi:hypothetical protein